MMSAVITNIGDLEFVWRSADDGFSSGVDFKKWLANTVIELRATVAEQARQLEEARNLVDQSCSDAVAIVNMSDGYVHEMAGHLANQLGAWLAANAPATQVEQEQAK